MLGLSSCSDRTDDRIAARSLVKLGKAAVPAIEQALDSIVGSGQWSAFTPNAGWLLLAYAKIEGPRAYPRLRAMISDPKLTNIGLNFDAAAALSLGLTSYVTVSRLPIRSFHCRRGAEPRDALDQLILGWERNDRQWLEASLGPNAKAALELMLKNRTWTAMRADLLRSKVDDALAIGYQFEGSGRWATPEETLEESEEDGNSTLGAAGREVNLQTVFIDRTGAICGKRRVRFVLRNGSGSESPNYSIDNSDLVDLLRSLGACFTRK